MRVQERHLDVFVSQELCHRFQTDPFHHQMTREGVSEIMEPKVFESGSLHHGLEDLADIGVVVLPTARKYVTPLALSRDFFELLQQDGIDREGPPLARLGSVERNQSPFPRLISTELEEQVVLNICSRAEDNTLYDAPNPLGTA